MKFYGPYDNIPRHEVDCSNKFKKQYIEIEPMTIDENTGEWINKTKHPIFKETTPFNIDEHIQSFKNDTDLYTLLERAQTLGDESILNQRQAYFGDIFDLKDNVADIFNDEANLNKLNELKTNLAKSLLNKKDEEKPNDLEEEKIQEEVNKRVQVELAKQLKERGITK